MSVQSAVTFSLEQPAGLGWCVVGSDQSVYYYALSYETAVAKLPHLQAMFGSA